jgi:hypothetical protein
MLASRFRATVSQKHHPTEGGQQQPCSFETRVRGADRHGSRKMATFTGGKQNHRCKACGRQFVVSAGERIIGDEQRTLIEHLLRERLSLRGICRAVGVSFTWLLHFMVECFAACPDHLHVQLPWGVC